MGVGRKMETMVLQKNPNHQLTYNINPHSGRHLIINELASVIFGCKYSTFKECIFKQLFGLPASHIKYVQNVTPGMPVFLFNYSNRTLHGVFEATTSGQMNINKYAWTLDGQEITPFPAQVRVKIRMQCHPLSEDQYKPILAKNYLVHEPNHLWFELDQEQTHKLILLFSNSPVSPSVSLPPTPAMWGTLFRPPAAPVTHQEECSSTATNIVMDQGLLCNSTRTVEGEEGSAALLLCNVAKASENGILSKTWSSLFKPQPTISPSKECQDSNSEVLSTITDGKPPIFSEATCVNEAPLMVTEIINVAEAPTLVSGATYLAEDTSSQGNSDLRAVVNKLTQAMGEVKELQSRQTMKIHNLELELEEASRKLRKPKSHCKESAHSKSSLSTRHLAETQFENQDVYQSILFVGGYDGSSWLQNLDSYCPFEDVMRPLVHMGSVCSYSSVVKLDEELYVLGGEYGSSWYNTVESYNLKSHKWVNCPSLNRKKGSLAAVSLLAKIFAIGGGDANDCFSEVEVLDLNVGKWIVTRSMLQKRFAPAAAELNGVLYVTGGYDGQEYVSSVERFDPRAFSWTRLKRMNSSRGCHSLTVLNEKLYAIGGYDGTKMVPTVEVFEPRTGSWTMSEPMKFARGGLGSVNFGGEIYAIGGMQENRDVLDTVECYSKTEGWRLMRPKSMGKRCFLSAVVV